ncbi:MAG: serine/threonine protein kinase [Neomegalonema sp.]|nr:serine/threonine protein kinase [Neomegalonema sp.]
MTNQDDPMGGQNPNLMATVWDAGPAQTATLLAAGDRFADRYEIKSQIGAGGMGVVYLAMDSVTKEEVVLKLINPSLLDPAARERMITEGVNTRKIRNPNVVAVYDVGEHDGQVFLSMERVAGTPLRSWMAENMAKRIDASLSDVLKITHEILSGLAAAHDGGVIHRDLKPENIMISGAPSAPGFQLKILDFGIARGLKTEVFTGSTPAMGTPLYMAPEQKTTPDAVGPSADIYSVGRMLYEMLMDVLPEGAWNPPSEQRSDVPQALDGVIRKALQAPKHRYQTVAEFAAALDEAVKGTKAQEVSQSVWSGDGGEKLRESIREYKQTVADRIETVKSGVSWLTESLKGWSASKPAAATATPAPTADAPPDAEAAAAKKRRTWMIAGGVIGVIVVLGVIDELLTTTPTITPVATERSDTGWRPYSDRSASYDGATTALSGSWRLEGGETFSVRTDGSSVEGTGVLAGIGPVRLSGPINGPIAIISQSTGVRLGAMVGGITPRSGGQPGYDWTGTATNLTTGATYRVLFHINH